MQPNWFKLIFWSCWVLFIYALTSMLTDPLKQERITRFLSEMAQKPYFIPLFFAFLLSAFLLFYLPVWWRSFRQQQLYKRLKTAGTPIMAQIIKVEDTGITRNKNPRLKITVAISGHTAAFELTVSRIHIPRAGDLIRVLYDPQNPGKAVPAADQVPF